MQPQAWSITSLPQEYSAGLMSQSFWFVEFKKLLFLMLSGADETDIKMQCIEQNLFGAAKEYRARRMYGYLSARARSLDAEMLALFCDADPSTQKLIDLVAMMQSDRLLFEFVYEVWREKAMIGAEELSREDVNVFFTRKERESELIAAWQDSTKKHLKSNYLNYLTEANLLRPEGKARKIARPILDLRLQQYLEKSGKSAILKAIAGVA